VVNSLTRNRLSGSRVIRRNVECEDAHCSLTIFLSTVSVIFIHGFISLGLRWHIPLIAPKHRPLGLDLWPPNSASSPSSLQPRPRPRRRRHQPLGRVIEFPGLLGKTPMTPDGALPRQRGWKQMPLVEDRESDGPPPP
jgi:hypothetical protein